MIFAGLCAHHLAAARDGPGVPSKYTRLGAKSVQNICNDGGHLTWHRRAIWHPNLHTWAASCLQCLCSDNGLQPGMCHCLTDEFGNLYTYIHQCTMGDTFTEHGVIGKIFVAATWTSATSLAETYGRHGRGPGPAPPGTSVIYNLKIVFWVTDHFFNI